LGSTSGFFNRRGEARGKADPEKGNYDAREKPNMKAQLVSLTGGPNTRSGGINGLREDNSRMGGVKRGEGRYRIGNSKRREAPFTLVGRSRSRIWKSVGCVKEKVGKDNSRKERKKILIGFRPRGGNW